MFVEKKIEIHLATWFLIKRHIMYNMHGALCTEKKEAVAGSISFLCFTYRYR